jgi:hypothetical protein
MRGPTRRQSKQSEKVETGRDSQLLLPVVDPKTSGKRNAKKNFTVFVKTPNGTKDKDTLKGTRGMARLHGSARSNELPCLRVNKPYESRPHQS